jgi:hypothetical protein
MSVRDRRELDVEEGDGGLEVEEGIFSCGCEGCVI